MSRRIAIGGFSHESNTYAVAVTGLTTRAQLRSWSGDDLVSTANGVGYVGGMLDGIREIGAEPVGTLLVRGELGGTIERGTFASIEDEIVSAVTDVLPVDGLILELHGAAAAEGIDGCEEHLVRRLRSAVGHELPIVGVFDLHGHPTPAWASLFTLVVPVREYPHVDTYDRGRDAAVLLGRVLDGAIRPVVHIERLPMLVPAASTQGGHGPGVELNERAAEVRRWPGMIDCAAFHGFPMADTPNVGASVVCTADGDAELAERGARHLASWWWAERDRFLLDLWSPADAVQHAALVDGPVVLAEVSDNPGGGAPGDGTKLLSAMIDHQRPGMVFAAIADPSTVACAERAGVGGTIDAELGAWSSPMQGRPIRGVARVEALSDGRFAMRSPVPGAAMNLGPSALLGFGDVRVVVTTRASQTFDERVFELHGIDVRAATVIGLKSAEHFRAGFESIAAEIVLVDAGGLTSERMDAYARVRAPGPMWPIDPGARWP